jgi:CRISPR-associated protein (TIGR03986 family)
VPVPTHFYHAYNYIPTPDRNDGSLPEAFRDGSPATHDHLAPQLLNGRIDVEMTVVTPLVIGDVVTPPDVGDTAAASNKRKHTRLRVASASGKPRGADGSDDVLIPITSVKGMLRSAFEAVTLSRFGQLPTADQYLTYRARASAALGLLPVRIEIQANGSVLAHPLDGAPGPTGSRPLPAAVWKDEQGGPDSFAPGGLELMHAIGRSQAVTDATLTLVQRNPGQQNAYHEWVVTHLGGIRTVTIGGPSRCPGVTYSITASSPGWLCRTGRGIIPNKHSERLFFSSRPSAPVPLTEDHVRRYRTILDSYVEGEGANPSEPVLSYVPSAAVPFHDGDLVYAVLDDVGGIVELVPTMIGRRTFQESPVSIAEARGMEPASCRAKASSADRTWGFVHEAQPGQPDSQGPRLGAEADAHRGQIVIGAVASLSVRLERPRGGIVLRELASPKPNAARFYVFDADGRPIQAQTGAWSSETVGRLGRKEEFYLPGDSLPRKVYPHHRSATSGAAFPATAVDPGGIPNDRNSTVESYIDRGSAFTFSVDFVNLTRLELAALVWLLDSRNLATADSPTGRGYHRLGHGRPLGLGSVQLDVTSVHVSTGKEVGYGYFDITSCLGLGGAQEDASSLAKEFDDFVRAENYNPLNRAIAAFRRSASGHPEHPDRVVSYPYALGRPNVGTVIPWFLWNETVQHDVVKGDLIPNRHGLSLPPLWAGDDALPWNPH